MTETLMRAAAEWATRPADERFLTLADLQAAVLERYEESAEEIVVTKDAEVMTDGDDLVLVTEEGGRYIPTHWSLGQLCRYAETPAAYIQRLVNNPDLAAECLNYGLWGLHGLDEMKLLVNVPERKQFQSRLRSVTSPRYGRIWDHQVVGAVMGVNADGRWKVPHASYQQADPKRATTLYASDRDVFIFLVDPDHPIEVEGETLFRGFYVWNSEVGSSVFGFTTFLYRYVCDNRIIWGPENIQEFRFRHTAGAPERFEEVIVQLPAMLGEYTSASAKETETLIRKAIRLNVGKTDDEVAEWITEHSSFSEARARAIIEMAQQQEGDAGTLWKVVQGATALAREVPHTDARIEMERQAASLMRYAA